MKGDRFIVNQLVGNGFKIDELGSQTARGVTDGELKITWSPDLNENGAKNVRRYTEFGRTELGGKEAWTDMKDVDTAEKNNYKFRKVTVDMP